MRLSGRFSEALVYAAAVHADQRRKVSGEPYLAHLLGAAAIVLEHGGNEDEAIAALLHDTIEDQGGAALREEIRRRFGPAVLEIVEGCSDTESPAQSPSPPAPLPASGARGEGFLIGNGSEPPLPASGARGEGFLAAGRSKPPWRQRKEAHVARLRRASASIRLVSAADKLHNARALLREYRLCGESVWGHFRGGREGTLWYYRAVADVLKQSGTSPLVEELDRVVGEIERLASRRGEKSS